MRILAVTNCIAGGSKLENHPSVQLYRKRFHDHLMTDGLIAIFSGRGFRLDKKCRDIVLTASKKDGAFKPHGGKDFDVFEPIRAKDLDAIIWTPYCDAAGYYTTAATEERLAYPSYTGVVGQAYPPITHPFPEVSFVLWDKLIALTKDIPKRVCLMYPTTFMQDDTEEHRLYKERWELYNSIASYKFSKAGWKMLTVAKPESNGDKWWAHFTKECRADLLHELDSYILGK